MMKLFPLLLFLALLWLIRRLHSLRSPRREKPVQQMVPCARCGTHVPEQQAFVEGDHYFCCRAHWQQGR